MKFKSVENMMAEFRQKPSLYLRNWQNLELFCAETENVDTEKITSSTTTQKITKITINQPSMKITVCILYIV